MTGKKLKVHIVFRKIAASLGSVHKEVTLIVVECTGQSNRWRRSWYAVSHSGQTSSSALPIQKR